ncbi:MAG TPA: FmdE family protein [Desulfobacteraceae bacterium]|nr:FmdE family protein [Desulfobacteraceae bacterium]HPJ68098.1 FmdE family protein [Desulfobacteraceae bacterium]
MNNTIITEDLIRETASFHGHWCPGLAIGIRASEWVLQELGRAQDEEIVAVVETDMCAIDAIQYLTGCTFGKGNLIHRDYGKNAFTFYRRRDGKSARLVLKPVSSTKERMTMEKLHKKMREHGLSAEEEKSRQEARAASSRRIMESDLTALFDIKPAPGHVPEKARFLSSLVCESCGEEVMETRTRRFGGMVLCIPCFEDMERR